MSIYIMKFFSEEIVLKTFAYIFFYPCIALVLYTGSITAQNTSFNINPISEISEGVFAPLRIAFDGQLPARSPA